MLPRRLSALVGIALVASACSTVPRAEHMQVTDFTARKSHGETLGLEVQGGLTMKHQITDEAFKEALESSLVASKLFTQLVRIHEAVYRLDVVMGDLRQPPGGFDMTVEMTVLWSLSLVDTEETIWQELVESRYEATVGDAFAAVTRLKLATEGAARENIRKGLEGLAKASMR